MELGVGIPMYTKTLGLPECGTRCGDTNVHKDTRIAVFSSSINHENVSLHITVSMF